jgi:hypothetical protein
MRAAILRWHVPLRLPRDGRMLLCSELAMPAGSVGSCLSDKGHKDLIVEVKCLLIR